MSLNVNGAGKYLTEAQLNALQTVMNNDADTQKLLDLFGQEDNEVAGYADEAADILGLSEDMIQKIAEADDVFKGLLDGSLTIDDLEKAQEAPATEGSTTTTSAENKNIKTREEVKALDEEVEKLRQEIEQIDKDIEAQKAKIKEKQKLLEAKQEELKEKQEALDKANDNLATEQGKLNDIERDIKAKEKEKQETEDLIKEKQALLLKKAEETQADEIKKAQSAYNPETDGDWNAFLMNKLEELNVDSSLSSEIKQLSNKLTGINTELNGLNRAFGAQQTVVAAASKEVTAAQGAFDAVNNEITALNDEISGAETIIQNKEAEKPAKQKEYDTKLAELEAAKASITVKDPTAASSNVPTGNDSTKTQDAIKDLVPEKELALVDKYGVDLLEKLSDGSPRYIFAEGADNNYHIYDMGNGGQGATLARLYEPGNGFDVVPSGSGYLNGFQEAGAGNGRTVYYFCGENVKELQGCYTTSSPLSFDLNGDGVKTSDEIVEFDIDGDGIVDKINDSADGVLVFDKDGDGISGQDGSECFGDNTDIDGDGIKDGYKDGFEALKAFARDKGLINDADDMVLDANDIKFLEENYGFGIKTEGYNSQAQSLTDLGITEINLANTDETTLEDNFDGNGNQLMTQQGATFVQNGETKEYADIWHRKLDEQLADFNATLDTPEIKPQQKTQQAYNPYEDFLANFDPTAYSNTLNAKVDLSFNFLDVNADAPDQKQDQEDEKID